MIAIEELINRCKLIVGVADLKREAEAAAAEYAALRAENERLRRLLTDASLAWMAGENTPDYDELLDDIGAALERKP